MAYGRRALAAVLVLAGVTWGQAGRWAPPASGLSPCAAGGEGWAVILADGFEGEFPGPWRIEPEPWPGEFYWARRSCPGRAHSGEHAASAAGAAGGVIPTPSCSDPYGNDQGSWLIAGPFDLRPATAAELVFWHWVDTAGPDDFLVAAASVDGLTYYGGTQLSGHLAASCAGGWCCERFDLSQVPRFGSFCGQRQVWIAFYFQSDGSGVGQGVYVDDVVLRIETGTATPTPTATASQTPSPTATATPSPPPSPTASATPSPAATATPSPSPAPSRSWRVALPVVLRPLAVEALERTLLLPR